MGESCFDVCTRVALLFGSINRDRFARRFGRDKDGVDTFILVSHGVTIRAFILMWAKQSPEVGEPFVRPCLED